jgi:hypothetical protein
MKLRGGRGHAAAGYFTIEWSDPKLPRRQLELATKPSDLSKNGGRAKNGPYPFKIHRDSYRGLLYDPPVGADGRRTRRQKLVVVYHNQRAKSAPHWG